MLHWSIVTHAQARRIALRHGGSQPREEEGAPHVSASRQERRGVPWNMSFIESCLITSDKLYLL